MHVFHLLCNPTRNLFFFSFFFSSFFFLIHTSVSSILLHHLLLLFPFDIFLHTQRSSLSPPKMKKHHHQAFTLTLINSTIPSSTKPTNQAFLQYTATPITLSISDNLLQYTAISNSPTSHGEILCLLYFLLIGKI